MSDSGFFRRRARVLRERLRADGAGRGWARRHWLWVVVLALALGATGTFDTWLYTCGFAGCPTTGQIRAFRAPEGGRILDRNGRLIGRLDVVRRVNVPLADVPAHVRAAFIATEDRHFYQHNGIDWRGFLRAAVRNVRAGGVREGFSTITMQVARNSFSAPVRFGQRTLAKKLVEMRLSRLIEQSLTKDQILELYLNVIYLGNGVYGVEAASRDLFGKSVKQLSLAEAAMIAGLPKAPSAYSPRRGGSTARALARRNIVLANMVREGYVSRDRAVAAAGTPLALSRRPWRPVQPDDNYAFDLVRAVVDSVTDALGEDLPEAVVYTTIDMTAQRAADRAVSRHAAEIQSEAAGRGAVEGAMVALDPATGDIRALVGGREYERGAFDRAVAARRQPGSAFKPFVYAAAIAAGYSPASMVDDEPVEVDLGHGRVWSPANFDGEYLGRVSMARALAKSLNAATVRVSRSIGEQRIVAVAQRNGIQSRLPVVPAVALGAVEVTPLELVTAYAPFANGGYRVRPRIVRRIERVDGTVVWSSPEPPDRVQVMDPRDAFQLTGMLRQVVEHGTAHAVRDDGVSGPIAGKTGTTNNGSDVWFVGFTPNLVAGFWFGFDNPRSLGGEASGGRLVAPAWADFYLQSRWRERYGSPDWQPPPGLISRVIDPETGYLANQWCPLQERQWFKPGTEPTDVCPVHTQPAPPPVMTDDGTGLPPDTSGDIVRGIGRQISKVWKKIFHP